MKCTIKQTQGILESLSFIYEVVRLVDPQNNKVILFDENENVFYEEYKCYQVWKKQGRCKNCVSMNALYNGSRMTKFEFVDDDVYYVVSKPITVIGNYGIETKCTLEIVSKITDEILFGAFGKKELAQRIMDSEKKIFKDSLTEVYNRRYFDERIFCHNDRCDLKNNVVFIMVDLNKFKIINDDYGHDIGDWVLRETAQSIQTSVSVSDTVIRMGGDEFLIVLSNCKTHNAYRIMKIIQEKIKNNVVYDKENNKYAIVNYGIAGTDNFEDTICFINTLLKEADVNMYKHKQGE